MSLHLSSTVQERIAVIIVAAVAVSAVVAAARGQARTTYEIGLGVIY